MPDGMTVRITDWTAFEPDALVYPAPRLAPHDLEVRNPMIVVEVLSPTRGARDTGAKLAGYFSLPSLAHYLVVDADTSTVTHHARNRDGTISAEVLKDGTLTL